MRPVVFPALAVTKPTGIRIVIIVVAAIYRAVKVGKFVVKALLFLAVLAAIVMGRCGDIRRVLLADFVQSAGAL